MAESILKQCVLRLKSAEIFPTISRWSYLDLRDLKQLEEKLCFKKAKRYLAIQILEHCQEKGGLTPECTGELDLIYVQQTSTKKIWNAYIFTDPCEQRSLCKTPANIKRRMTKYLRLYFHKDCCVTTMLHNGLLWGRVYLPQKGVKKYQSTRCLYFIHYPQTQVIIINGMKSAYSQFIKQCFVGAFGFKDITDMSLTGHHQESLAELAINKHSEGGFTRFQRERRRSGPLEETSSRKRKAPEEILDDRIVDESSVEKRLRLEKLEQAFGENVQPTIEKIEYRVELPYRGRDVAEDLKNSSELFMSKVVFRGSNVLEGLRNLAEHGYTSIPLPKHLTCVPTRARNYFLLSKAKKDTDGTNKSLSESRGVKETNPNQSNTSIRQRGVLKELGSKPTRTSPRKNRK